MLRLLFSCDGFSRRDATPAYIDARDLAAVESGSVHQLNTIEIVAEDGEIEFDHEPTEQELLDAFPGRADALVAVARENARAPILAELIALDAFLPRALEDTWASMGFDTATLPQAQRDRLARKLALRSDLSAI